MTDQPIDLPRLKALAADLGVNVVTSPYMPPGWDGLIYNPPPDVIAMFGEDELGPTLIVREPRQEGR